VRTWATVVPLTPGLNVVLFVNDSKKGKDYEESTL